ncbi:phospholipase D-like domain-containing protein, partial [Pseudoalteromonas sp. SIMBA_148]
EKAGVFVHQSLRVGLFKTLFKRSDLRNHRKMVVIDEHIGYIGSFNLVDPRFFKQNKNVGQWIDVAIRTTSQQAISINTAMA